MINGMDFALVFKHKNLILHVSRHIKICFYRRFDLCAALIFRNAESFAPRRDPIGVLIEVQIGERGSEANWVPGCVCPRLGEEGEGVHLQEGQMLCHICSRVMHDAAGSDVLFAVGLRQ